MKHRGLDWADGILIIAHLRHTPAFSGNCEINFYTMSECLRGLYWDICWIFMDVPVPTLSIQRQMKKVQCGEAWWNTAELIINTKTHTDEGLFFFTATLISF